MLDFTTDVGTGSCGAVTDDSGANVTCLTCAGLYFGGGAEAVPLVCSWNWVGHWPCAWAARGASAKIATHARTDASAAPELR